MAVHYSITAQALAKPNISVSWLTSAHSLWPCWCTEEIRKWKQIRKMPQDCIHPWKIKQRGTVPPKSHVKHIDHAHLSPRLLCNLTAKPLHFTTPDSPVWCVPPEALLMCAICLLEKQTNKNKPGKTLTHKWSYLLSERQQACHLLKICAVLETQKDTSGGFHTATSALPKIWWDTFWVLTSRAHVHYMVVTLWTRSTKRYSPAFTPENLWKRHQKQGFLSAEQAAEKAPRRR